MSFFKQGSWDRWPKSPEETVWRRSREDAPAEWVGYNERKRDWHDSHVATALRCRVPVTRCSHGNLLPCSCHTIRAMVA